MKKFNKNLRHSVVKNIKESRRQKKKKQKKKNNFVTFQLQIATVYFIFLSCVCVDIQLEYWWLVGGFLFVFLLIWAKHCPYCSFRPMGPAWAMRGKYTNSYFSCNENSFWYLSFLKNYCDLLLPWYMSLKTVHSFNTWYFMHSLLYFKSHEVFFYIFCHCNYGI